MKHNRSKNTFVDYKAAERAYEKVKDIFVEEELNLFEVRTIVAWIECDTMTALANLTYDYRIDKNSSKEGVYI